MTASSTDIAFNPYVVVGAGAIGGTVAAHLCRNGHAVHLVDADAKHVRSIAEDGLRLVGGPVPVRVHPPATTPDAYLGELHRVLLAVKSPATVPATEWIGPRLATDGFVASLQNGMCESRIAAVVGEHRTVGAFVNLFADRTGPGEITYGGAGSLVFGEPSGGAPSARVQQLADDLRTLHARVSDNVLGFLWAKLGYFAMLATTALDDVPMAVTIGENAPVMVALAREVYAVATAQGIELERFDAIRPEDLLPASTDQSALDAVADIGAWMHTMPKQHGGIWRDVVVRRQKTEVGDQLGGVCAAAAELGLPTPGLHEVIAQVAKVEDGGERGPFRLSMIAQALGIRSRHG